MRINKILGFSTLILTATLGTAACGGSDDSSTPTSPSNPSSPSTPGTPETTITISSNGVASPRTLTVPAGTRVTFVNNDSRSHEMDSDPHPVHTDCPEINQVGFLQAGQTKQTGALNTRRTCGYHDHQQESNTNLQGNIVIQ